MAIACFGFVTLRPLPERRRPRLNSCISSPTFCCAFRPYRRPRLLALDFLPVDFLPARLRAVVERRDELLLAERREVALREELPRDDAVRLRAVDLRAVLRREELPLRVPALRDRELDLRAAIVNLLDVQTRVLSAWVALWIAKVASDAMYQHRRTENRTR
jgi:hypothetical protein